jgi:hypothetical protein
MLMKKERKRHGGPYDRGSADYYYCRPYRPHYYLGSTYKSPRVDESSMTDEEIQEYANGWGEALQVGDRKDYR